MKHAQARVGASRLARLFALVCVAASPLACGPTGPGMAQVTGKVTYQGKPVPKGTITFVTTSPEGRNATGALDPDGNYRLQTENPGDGALLGDYKVTVYAHDEPVLDYIPRKPIPPKILSPTKYEKPETSDLKAAVKSGSNELNFELVD